MATVNEFRLRRGLWRLGQSWLHCRCLWRRSEALPFLISVWWVDCSLLPVCSAYTCWTDSPLPGSHTLIYYCEYRYTWCASFSMINCIRTNDRHHISQNRSQITGESSKVNWKCRGPESSARSISGCCKMFCLTVVASGLPSTCLMSSSFNTALHVHCFVWLMQFGEQDHLMFLHNKKGWFFTDKHHHQSNFWQCFHKLFCQKVLECSWKKW